MAIITVTLNTPITIGTREVSGLAVTTPFRTGFLRGAPKTPQWFIDAARKLMARMQEIMGARDAALDKDGADMSADRVVPAPSLSDDELMEGLDVWPRAEDIDELVPWLAHIAEKATGETREVVDQLDLGDLLKIIFTQLQGMMSLVNFRTTSAAGAVTSPGSSTGRPAT